MTPWTWFAGEEGEATYSLAEEPTRDDAIRVACGQLEPGERFQICEARMSTAMKYEGSDFIPFIHERNHEVITVGPRP